MSENNSHMLQYAVQSLLAYRKAFTFMKRNLRLRNLDIKNQYIRYHLDQSFSLDITVEEKKAQQLYNAETSNVLGS